MTTVGERIKEIRISKGITQADLAKALNTTTAAISRYELGKRELRFTQAQAIAEVLDVSVFELYGFPSEQTIRMEQSKNILARIKAQIQFNSEGEPSEFILKLNDCLQDIAEKTEKEMQDQVELAVAAHRAQVQVSLLDQADSAENPEASLCPGPTSGLQNKRVEKLVNMFRAFPSDAQNRILDIISTFKQLNGVGQKHAVSRIKELAELPRYQTKQEETDAKK